MSDIRACIFDMDGVLCASEELLCQSAVTLFKARYRQDVTPEDFEPFIGAGEERYLMGVAEKYGVTLKMPEAKTELYDIYLELIPGRLQPMPGVVPFVKSVRESGCRTAVATSADGRKMTANLKAIGLPAEEFDAVVKREDVEHPKPAPDLFLHAARLLDLPPEQCLVFEDALNGIEAARAAGCRVGGVIGSFSGEALLNAGADCVFDDFAQARTRLEECGCWLPGQPGLP